jgi:hypothetical protein
MTIGSYVKIHENHLGWFFKRELDIKMIDDVIYKMGRVILAKYS